MIKKKTSSSCVFKNFPDYWHFARHLSKDQRRVVFNSLPPEQQELLTKSYNNGKWDELFFRNDLNDKADKIKEEYGYDLFEIKCKVFSNKSVYLPRKFWEIIQKEFSRYKENSYFVIGGIESIVCEVNNDVVLLVREIIQEEEEEEDFIDETLK